MPVYEGWDKGRRVVKLPSSDGNAIPLYILAGGCESMALRSETGVCDLDQEVRAEEVQGYVEGFRCNVKVGVGKEGEHWEEEGSLRFVSVVVKGSIFHRGGKGVDLVEDSPVVRGDIVRVEEETFLYWRCICQWQGRIECCVRLTSFEACDRR